MKYLANRSARCSSWLRRVSLTYSLSALVLALGGSVLLAQPSATPQRIISIVPAVTEMLFAIGAGTQVAAVSSFDLSPQASALPRVGALLDPDMERIFVQIRRIQRK